MLGILLCSLILECTRAGTVLISLCCCFCIHCQQSNCFSNNQQLRMPSKIHKILDFQQEQLLLLLSSQEMMVLQVFYLLRSEESGFVEEVLIYSFQALHRRKSTTHLLISTIRELIDSRLKAILNSKILKPADIILVDCLPHLIFWFVVCICSVKLYDVLIESRIRIREMLLYFVSMRKLSKKCDYCKNENLHCFHFWYFVLLIKIADAKNITNLISSQVLYIIIKMKQKHKHRRSNSAQVTSKKHTDQASAGSTVTAEHKIFVSLIDMSIAAAEIIECINLSSEKVQSKHIIVEQLSQHTPKKSIKQKPLRGLYQIEEDLRNWDKFEQSFLNSKMHKSVKPQILRSRKFKNQGCKDVVLKNMMQIYPCQPLLFMELKQKRYICNN